MNAWANLHRLGQPNTFLTHSKFYGRVLFLSQAHLAVLIAQAQAKVAEAKRTHQETAEENAVLQVSMLKRIFKTHFERELCSLHC